LRGKFQPQRALAVAAFDQETLIGDLGEIADPVAVLVICHDARLQIAGGVQNIRIGGYALWHHHHPINRQAQRLPQLCVAHVAASQ
jgi:hypothetical protein